mmetsp:Transcript_8932/g.27031  ORF Transcript_8932/g.27031 Transcript_8932/m.27031 type:complete len:259 (+) Transcript_8932:587-1363(+)
MTCSPRALFPLLLPLLLRFFRTWLKVSRAPVTRGWPLLWCLACFFAVDLRAIARGWLVSLVVKLPLCKLLLKLLVLFPRAPQVVHLVHKAGCLGHLHGGRPTRPLPGLRSPPGPRRPGQNLRRAGQRPVIQPRSAAAYSLSGLLLLMGLALRRDLLAARGRQEVVHKPLVAARLLLLDGRVKGSPRGQIAGAWRRDNRRGSVRIPGAILGAGWPPAGLGLYPRAPQVAHLVHKAACLGHLHGRPQGAAVLLQGLVHAA